MTRLSLAVALLAACAGVAACSSKTPVTELLVVVDSDLSVPAELDEVRVDLVGPGGEVRRSEGALASDAELPRTLALVHRGGPLGPVRITVTGRHAGSDLVQRRATATFISGETRVLRLHLLRECLNMRCSSTETCASGGCRAIDVAPSELEPWTGGVGRFDASVPDAQTDGGDVDACVAAPEICNGVDDDCNGMTDEGFDLTSDPMHCGSCDNVCPADPANAAAACTASTCQLTCDDGYADCDGMLATGCEASLSAVGTCGNCTTSCSGATSLCADDGTGLRCVSSCPGGTTSCSGSCVDTTSDAMHCGMCDRACPSVPNASARCVASACTFACDMGFHQCDGMSMNGCESRYTELTNCGGCGVLCELPGALESCATGACSIVACDPDSADCDGMVGTGCEADVSSDVMRCGDCTRTCPLDPPNATGVCAMGSCAVMCDLGFADCNDDPGDGCETSLGDPASCGSCAVSCADPTPVCVGDAMSGFGCASGCMGATMTCGGSCVDTTMSTLHCGGCDMPCASAPNSTPVCTASVCGVVCAMGYGDCNTMPMDGCEITLASDLSNCGMCGRSCPMVAGSTPTCTAGTCGIACLTGRRDCNTMAADGCEIDIRTDPANCGMCGMACPTTGMSVASVGCSMGACTIMSCTSAWRDCDGSFATGCEIDTALDRNNCGMCGNRCGSGQRCCSGTCMRSSSC